MKDCRQGRYVGETYSVVISIRALKIHYSLNRIFPYANENIEFYYFKYRNLKFLILIFTFRFNEIDRSLSGCRSGMG
jgi:hypothetical protein